MYVLHNAYNIFGLTIDADDKLINKRYKELLNLLKIEEVPGYPNDIEWLDYNVIRTEEKINRAHSNLTNLAKKLREQFFWFEFDEEAASRLLPKILSEPNEDHEIHYKKTQAYEKQKNTILSQLLYLEHIWSQTKRKKKSIDYEKLIQSIKSLLGDEKFWNQFSKIRSLFSGLEIRDDLITSLRYSLPQIFAEHFFDLSEYIWDHKLYESFTKAFNIHAKELDDNKNIQAIHNKINTSLSQLEKYGANLHKIEDIITTLDTLSEAFSELKKIWLKGTDFYDSAIEKAVISGRNICLYLHNNHSKTHGALSVSEKILTFDMSESRRHKIKDDLIKLKEQVKEKLCQFCNKNESDESCAKIVPIHKVTERSWWSVLYKSLELKIPRCSECRDKHKSSFNLLMIIWAISGISLWFFFEQLFNHDPDDILWLILLGLIISWIVVYVVNLFSEEKTCYKKAQIFQELQRDGWVEWEKPANVR
jgi:hypothetical protein